MPLVLILGGARSGKSRLALRLAERQAAPVVFVATAQAGDGDMAERIARHRRERPPAWSTVEEPLDLTAALTGVAPGACVVVDCLTLWVANLLPTLDPADIETRAATAAREAAARQGMTVAVTNEVGLSIVPANELGRGYRDLLGRVNAIWADAADHALFLVAGRVLELPRADGVVDGLT